jgi:hypothetical protein
VADVLRRDVGANVQLQDGARGEFTVLVGGQKVAEKGAELPTVGEVVAATRQALSAPTSIGP